MLINNILQTKLKIISLDQGDVYHYLKKTDNGFKSFGEVYFSEIYAKQIKAWKRHLEMTLNLVVPYGNVRFVFIDDNGDILEKIIGQKNYLRLTVPPGIWFGFQGTSETPYSLITNVSDIEHSPDEVERKEIDYFKFNWN